VREKLERARPPTVGHARRLPGVTAAAVSLVLVHLKRRAEAEAGCST
jgi:tRNA uridine 5-carboxymethylaminomethyl modification enzyme